MSLLRSMQYCERREGDQYIFTSGLRLAESHINCMTFTTERLIKSAPTYMYTNDVIISTMNNLNTSKVSVPLQEGVCV